jgi:predicted HicB family RNase H-like nuclease
MMTIRVAPEIKAAIQKAAAADDRSVTVWVERALTAYMRQHGLLKK